MTYALPELRKKVIYLDQFVFSNIMKMLSAETPGHERAKSEPLWRELFESLDVLCSMQLVICPDSTEHHDESLISPFFEELKSTYEHFSRGTSFSRSSTILDMQVVEAFEGWLKNVKLEFDFDSHRVAHPNLHGWQDRIFITTSGTLPGEKQAIKHGRRTLHTGLRDLFKQWQAEKKSFAEVFELEKAGYSELILRGIERDRKQAVQMESLLSNFGSASGPLPRSITQYSPTMNTSLMYGLRHIASMHLLEKYKSDLEQDQEKVEDEAREKVVAFVESGALSETPANTIGASMYAALAWRAATGQKKTPDEGMTTDIKVVSTLLPYCDAMFVDNICRSLLNEIPHTHKLPYKCAVFSAKTSSEFLQYLGEIRKSATPEHLELLKDVYGATVLQPPTSIYGVGKRK
ncbi:MAG TPA: hypothetical protein VGN44_17715 [Candidatus Angelobacter sp.]|jgi:hypothetical protein